MYTPVKPQFYYIQVGCKGVFVTRTRFRDVVCRMIVCAIHVLKFSHEETHLLSSTLDSGHGYVCCAVTKV